MTSHSGHTPDAAGKTHLVKTRRLPILRMFRSRAAYLVVIYTSGLTTLKQLIVY